MDLFHAQVLAEAIRTAVEQLEIEHLDAAAGHVTCSLGLAVMSVGQVLDRAGFVASSRRSPVSR